MIEELVVFLSVLILLIGSILLVVYLHQKLIHTVTIQEGQTGLRFNKGNLTGRVSPGRYTRLGDATRIVVYELRPQLLQLNGQEILTADQVSVKVNLLVNYQLTDPELLYARYADHHEFLYTGVQMKLREVFAELTLDQIMGDRAALQQTMTQKLTEEFVMAGLVIQGAALKDLMLPAELKKVFGDVIKARKMGEASLEKARGESATLRSLANSARILEKNPELVRLRLIHTMETTQGNTFVLHPENSPANHNE